MDTHEILSDFGDTPDEVEDRQLHALKERSLIQIKLDQIARIARKQIKLAKFYITLILFNTQIIVLK